MPTTSFTRLDVWQKAYGLVLDLYKDCTRFPKDEKYRMSDQLLRASMSIPTNIAEGYGRRAPRDKAHFYTISSGSAEELKCWLMLARDLGFLPAANDLLRRVEDVSRMLRRLLEATLRSAPL
jgi:four helix bundle protein